MNSTSVLLIGDFHRRESRVELLARHVERELRIKGAHVNIILPDGPEEQPSRIAAVSDAIVVMARERNQSYSGIIKTLLDLVDTESVAGKPFGLICYGESEPVASMVDHLRVVVQAMKGVPVPCDVRMPLCGLTPDPVRATEGNRAAAGSISALVGELLRYSRRTPQDPCPAQQRTPGQSEPASDMGFDLARPVKGKIYEGVALAVAYIKENFSDQNLSLDTVASAVFMSRYHFSRKFREETGRRFIDYLIMVRMTEARKLLIETNWTVTAIASEVGYRDLSNFERSFKKLFGTQPSQYRQRYAKPTVQRLRGGPPARVIDGEGNGDVRVRALRAWRGEVRGPAGPRPGRHVPSRPRGTLRRLAARARPLGGPWSRVHQDGSAGQHPARPPQRGGTHCTRPAPGELPGPA
jgi:AraC-like DNA-binding protein/NAD(P)H-dependent FMN reductase